MTFKGIRQSSGTILLTVTILASCKKSQVVGVTASYFRFINIDGPVTFVTSQGRSVNDVQLYLNGRINGNGDSVVLNSDGSFFRSATINYSPLGWTDLTDPRTLGVYGYEISKRDNNGNLIPFAPSDYHYFPNPTHRIKRGSIVSGLNFYKWASISSGPLQLDLKRVDKIGVGENQGFLQGPTVLSSKLFLESGTVNTGFLVNKAFSIGFNASYRLANLNNGFSNYGIYPDLRGANLTHFFLDNDPQLVLMTDHPDRFHFKDSTAYVRFLNVTPKYVDPNVNGATDQIDVYVAPVIGATYRDLPFNIIGKEVLAASNLERFASTTDLPFFAIDVRPWMRPAQSRPDSINTFEVIVYRSGESASGGNSPIARGDFLYTFYTDNNVNPVYNGVDAPYRSWLVRSDGTHYFPSITSVALFVNSDGISCGFRSIIAYEQSFLNANYIKK